MPIHQARGQDIQAEFDVEVLCHHSHGQYPDLEIEEVCGMSGVHTDETHDADGK